MGVDKLLVGLVHERSEEEYRGTYQGQAPEWNNLDQIVRDESTDERLEFVSDAYKTGGSRAYSARNENVLCENNALGFNDEEVDKLMNVANERVESLL